MRGVDVWRQINVTPTLSQERSEVSMNLEVVRWWLVLKDPSLDSRNS